MHDKIITVKPKGNPKLFRTLPLLWTVTSSHAKHLDLLTRRKSLDKVDLLCLTDLGFNIICEDKPLDLKAGFDDPFYLGV